MGPRTRMLEALFSFASQGKPIKINMGCRLPDKSDETPIMLKSVEKKLGDNVLIGD